MSKIGGLRALIDTLIGPNPQRMNADALLMKQRGLAKARDYTPIETWDEFLNERNMVPNGVTLSNYANLPRAKEFSDQGLALRTQKGTGLNIGNSATPSWLGTHFDLAGGPQALDILAANKRTPTRLIDPTLVEAVIDQQARVLPVGDFMVNTPNHLFWESWLGAPTGATRRSAGRLADMLREQGVQGLVYRNMHEGVNGPNVFDTGRSQLIPQKYARELRPLPLHEVVSKTSNPGIAVLDPNILDIRHIGKKRGGLVQMCNCRK